LLMDPIGLGLENFDGIGAFRTHEAGLPIDPTGTLDGTPFQNPVELGQALRHHPGFPGCLARSLYRYATAHLEGDGEAAVIAELESRFAGAHYDFQELLVATIESASFRFSGAPQ